MLAPGEGAGFPLEEGAFYGQVFTHDDDDPIEWFACRGRDQARGEFGGLVNRDCAEPDPADPAVTQCGFTYAGDCDDACNHFDAGGTFYAGCRADHRRVHQVITTYVAD